MRTHDLFFFVCSNHFFVCSNHFFVCSNHFFVCSIHFFVCSIHFFVCSNHFFLFAAITFLFAAFTFLFAAFTFLFAAFLFLCSESLVGHRMKMLHIHQDLDHSFSPYKPSGRQTDIYLFFQVITRNSQFLEKRLFPDRLKSTRPALYTSALTVVF